MKPSKKEILVALKPTIEKAYPLMQQHGLKDITAYYNGSGDDFNSADFNFETNKGHVLSKEAANHIEEEISSVVGEFLTDYDPTGFQNLGAAGTFRLNLTECGLSVQMESERFIFRAERVIPAKTVNVFYINIPEDKIEAYLNGVDILQRKKIKKPTPFK